MLISGEELHLQSKCEVRKFAFVYLYNYICRLMYKTEYKSVILIHISLLRRHNGKIPERHL